MWREAIAMGIFALCAAAVAIWYARKIILDIFEED